jgi:hypothetical protein
MNTKYRCGSQPHFFVNDYVSLEDLITATKRAERILGSPQDNEFKVWALRQVDDHLVSRICDMVHEITGQRDPEAEAWTWARGTPWQILGIAERIVARARPVAERRLAIIERFFGPRPSSPTRAPSPRRKRGATTEAGDAAG